MLPFFLNHGFKFQGSISNGCHGLTILCPNISGMAIITDKNVGYRCIIHIIIKCEAIDLSKKSVFEDCGYI